MRKKILCVLTISWCFLVMGNAQADPWRYPDEISVARVYNSFYKTTYDENSQKGLKDLYTDHQGTMLQTWNTSFLKTLDVLVYDTSSMEALSVGESLSSKQVIFTPDRWTSPSRGPISMATVDLEALLGKNTAFSLYLGATVLTPFNTLMIKGNDYDAKKTFFLAHNQGGWSGDADFNEPVMVANYMSTPEPATMLLLGAGLAGLGLGGRKRYLKR